MMGAGRALRQRHAAEPLAEITLTDRAREWKDSASLKPLRPLLAALMLVAWLLAAGHIALYHGGAASGQTHHLVFGGAEADDHDDDAPSHDGEHHHHEFSMMAEGQEMKSAPSAALMPVLDPLFDALVKHFADRLHQKREPRPLPTRGHAPPDERASGWLLVCQTALPVRGPSLVV